MKLNLVAPKTSQLYLIYAIALFAWSFGPICVRFAFQYDIPPDVIATLRMIIGSIAFTPFVWSKYRPEIMHMQPRIMLLIMVGGVLFGMNLLAMTNSLEHISVIINQVLVATNPIWVAILAVTILKSNLNRTVWTGIFVAFVGGFLIAIATSGESAIVEGGNAALGVSLALLSALAGSFYIIIGRKVREGVSFIPYIWIAYVSGSVATLLIIAINQIPIIGYQPVGYFWVLLLALLAQIIGHGALNYVLKFLPATTLSVTGQSVPVLSGIWAMLIFSEVPTILQIMGSIVILIGVTLVIVGQNRPKSKRTTT